MCSKSSIVYLPLVKANACIGVEQFHERTKTIIDEAIKLSKKRSAENDCSSGSGKKQRLNSLATDSNTKRDEPSTLVRCNATVGLDIFGKKRKHRPDCGLVPTHKYSPTKRQRLHFETISTANHGNASTIVRKSAKKLKIMRKKTKNETVDLNRSMHPAFEQSFCAELNQRIECDAILTPEPGDSALLVRCKSIIGMKKWYWSNDYINQNFQQKTQSSADSGTTSSTSDNKIKQSDLSKLIQCNSDSELLHTQEQSLKEKTQSNFESTSTMMNDTMKIHENTLTRSESVLGSELLAPNQATLSDENTQLTDTHPNKNDDASSTSNLAKSRQMQLTMSRERLMRLEEAIQDWNGYFGTQYTLLPNE